MLRHLPITLNDATIRSALLSKLRKLRPRAIIEELRITNGNAIADVVTLHSEAHCYEIKGSSDKITRIQEQRIHYNKSFRRITLVTTPNHLAQAMLVTPSFWGIIVSKVHKNSLKFSRVRGAKLNPHFRPEVALQTLWKDEMIRLLSLTEKDAKRSTRSALVHSISAKKSAAAVSAEICEQLVSRKNRALMLEEGELLEP